MSKSMDMEMSIVRRKKAILGKTSDGRIPNMICAIPHAIRKDQ